MIIITAIGRCGTSFLANFFKECGLDIGSKKWFEPINAGLENRETLSINATLINHFVKKEKINIYRSYADIYDLNYDLVKDPQFLTDARIIEEWWKIRQDLKIIFLYREHDQIVESMKRVIEWNTPVFRLFPEMIEQKNNEFLEMVDQLQIPIIKFKYPDFLNQGKELINQVSEWVELPEDALEIYNDLVE